MVLQCAGDDFGRAGRTAVDEDDHRLALGQIARFRVPAVVVLRIAAAGADDLARIQERVADIDRLVQQPAGVVAQVKDEARDVVDPARVRDRLVDLRLERRERLVVEGGHAQHNRVAFGAGLDRLQLDRVADDLDVERLGLAFAQQGDRDLGPDRAAHLVHRVVQRQAHQGFAVHMGDEVARLDARLRGGRVVDRRDDLDEPVFLPDLDPQAAKGAARLGLQVLVVGGGDKTRMRVERGQHPVDRGLDQGLVVHLFDILAADLFKDAAEQVELLVKRGVLRAAAIRRFLRDQGSGELRRDEKSGQRAAEPCNQIFLHSDVLTCSA